MAYIILTLDADALPLIHFTIKSTFIDRQII